MPPKRGNRSGRGRNWGSRDVKENINPRQRSPTTNNTDSRQSQLFDNLRYRLKRSPDLYGLRGVKETWELAGQTLSTTENDVRQKVLRKLIDDEGLHHVKHVLDLRPHNFMTPRDFVSAANAFLRVVTEDFFFNCISLDTDLGTLYHFIGGANGTRGITFFKEVTSYLSKLGPTRENVDTFSKILQCLHQLVCREPRAQMNPELPELVNYLKGFYSKTQDVDIDIKVMIDQKLSIIERIIQRTAAQSCADGAPNEAQQVSKRFAHVKDIEVPGSRHDNDKEDIGQIQIVPTELEIRCNQADFLPTTDFSEPHFLEGPERLLDVHFRLLRHDIFSGLKETMAGLTHVVDNGLSTSTWADVVAKSQGAHIYRSASLVKSQFTKRAGLQFCISFRLPERIAKLKKQDRSEWWKRSRRLSPGTLLCLVLIQGRRLQIIPLIAEENEIGKDGVSGLITAKPVVLTSDATRRLLEHNAQYSRSNDKNLVMEFSSVLPATFVPILENLQRMHREGNWPFAQWLVPKPFEVDGVPGSVDVPPPLYARNRGFYFEMGSILNTPDQSLQYRPGLNEDRITEQLKSQSPLDEGQVSATVAALSREFCLIRGPPGTGKTFAGVQIMKVLIANKERAQLGPVVVVCYTNHALDQFLEHIMLQGITNVIRVGSRSSSTMLELKKLETQSRDTKKTGGENYLIAMSHRAREELEHQVTNGLRTLNSLGRCQWRAFDRFLRMRFPGIHRQFLKKDEEGFTKQMKGDPFDLWVKDVEKDYRPVPEVPLNNLLMKAENDVWTLTPKEKARLLSHFMTSLRDETVHDTIAHIKEEQQARSEATNVYNEIDRRTLQAADVIGITTTGLAKKIPVLQHVKAKVVVCEEAGEVLEAHMLSTMLPSVEHIIQIGDHEQLRPQIANFSLAMESNQGKLFQLDRSQFERLTLGEPGLSPFPLSELSVQRRMRPEISTLVRSTLYPQLIDDAKTKSYPNVVGMGNNVMWLDHDVFEDHAGELTGHSKSNSYEVKIVHALVRHIVRQGVYGSKDIAVLTPYVGQLQKLRDAMNRDFEVVISERDEEELLKTGLTEQEIEKQLGARRVQKKKMSELLRIATVDNFQGEEAKVVIISLVRSNDQKKVGFLRTTNRINVLLSRAQHGMYIIGNTRTYTEIPMWARTLTSKARKAGAKKLAIRDLSLVVTIALPNVIPKLSIKHSGVPSPARESKKHADIRALGYVETLVRSVWLSSRMLHCRVAMYTIYTVTRRVISQHLNALRLSLRRDDYVITRWKFIATKTSTFWNLHARGRVQHFFLVVINALVTAASAIGMAQDLDCQNIKSACSGAEESAALAVIIVKSCAMTEVTAVLVIFRAKFDVIILSAVSVAATLARHALRNAPGIVNIRVIASYRVLQLANGCRAICGVQNSWFVGTNALDYVFRTYNEIDVDRTPIVALGCGHFFTAETLDGHFGITDHYTMTLDGKIIGIKRRLGAAISQQVPRCPDCATPVAQHATNRYKRILNQRVMDESIKKAIASGERRLWDFEADLAHKDELLRELCDKKGLTFVAHCDLLAKGFQQSHDRLSAFLKVVSDENQPVRRLYDATIRAIQQKMSLEDSFDQISITDLPGRCPDQRIVLACTALLLRLNGQAIEADLKKLKAVDASMEVTLKWTLSDLRGYFAACERFLEDGAAQAFPKIQAEVSLYYGQTARLVQTIYNHQREEDRSVKAREYLSRAAELCNRGFSNSENLLTAVEALTRLLESERYEAITHEEFQAIKSAMLIG
ncbi:hypothetical protein KEM56_002975 [Ascosphaera pollenicola]|nr:hypothetical protein KEM56_002975 [Ascosphaera pollenicola]